MTPIRFATASYAEQAKHWPQSGRHILAQFDDDTINFYQAYSPGIGQFAVENGSFGCEFKYTRMSWIKPNFLWMMYRSNWGQAKGQEVVLAIRLKRTFFDSLVAQAVPSTLDERAFRDHDEWASAVAKSDVRLQWDPDHLPTGEKCERRAIQFGLRGATLEAYGKQEIVEVIDVSRFVAEQRPLWGSWKDGNLRTPVEQIYIPSQQGVGERLGLELFPKLH